MILIAIFTVPLWVTTYESVSSVAGKLQYSAEQRRWHLVEESWNSDLDQGDDEEIE